VSQNISAGELSVADSTLRGIGRLSLTVLGKSSPSIYWNMNE